MLFSDYVRGDKLPKSYLVEGGNVKIKDEYASHIDLDAHDRQSMTTIIMEGLTELNNRFKEDTGLYIWKPSILKDGIIFSGSTRHFFNRNIDTEKFKSIKKTVGDIDLMVDDEIKDLLKSYLDNNEDEEFKQLKFIGYKKSGDQFITLWKVLPAKINIQIDFELVPFEKDKPTKWSEFSHSSSYTDLEQGIKGVFHKLLMTALLGHKKTDSILQLKTKQKEIKAGIHALSIKGLRKKYEKIGEQDGKPVIKETGSKEFVNNFYEIIKEVFNKEADEKDVEDFYSFSGMLKMIKKYLSLHEIEGILDDFVDRIFGTQAQGLYRGEPNRDLDEKMVALKFAEKELDTKFSKDKLETMQKEFYSRYK